MSKFADYMERKMDELIKDAICISVLKTIKCPCVSYLMLPSYEKTYVNSEKNLQMLKEMYDSRINSSENRPILYRASRIDNRISINPNHNYGNNDDSIEVYGLESNNTSNRMRTGHMSLSYNVSPLAAILSPNEKDGRTACTYLIYCFDTNSSTILSGFDFTKVLKWNRFIYIPKNSTHEKTLKGNGEYWHPRSMFPNDTHYENNFGIAVSGSDYLDARNSNLQSLTSSKSLDYLKDIMKTMYEKNQTVYARQSKSARASSRQSKSARALRTRSL